MAGPAGGAGAPPMGRYGTLRVVSGNDQGKVLELNRPLTTIGRGADQMLVVADIAVSRRHLQIHMTPNGYRLQDMGSPNGTMVNGKRVSEVQLMDGDQMEVGNTLMRFEHAPSRPQPESPPPAYAPPPPAYGAQPGYGAPPMQMQQMPMQQMGYPQQGYPQQGYMQQPMQPMQQMPMQPQMMPGYPPQSVVQPMPPQMMPPQMPPQQMQSSPQQLSGDLSVMAVGVGGGGFLANPQKSKMAIAAAGGALLVGLIGLAVTVARSGNPQKSIEKASELYVNGTKDFTANHYDTARKSFQEALALAPDSQELKHYIEACDTEEKTHKLIEAAKKEIEDRRYVQALKQFAKVDKGSVQYEDAQQQARQARREAVKEVVSQATATAKSDAPAALEQVNKALTEIDPDSSELAELKAKLSNAPAPKPQAEEPVAEPEQKSEPDEPKKEPKREPKVAKAEPKKEPKKEPVKAAPEPAAAGGDLASNKQALAAYKSRDFAGAISAMKAVKNPKAQATAKDLEDIKAKTDQATKAEGSKPADAVSAYQAAAAIDKRLGGALASFYSGKISGLQSKGGGGAKPPAAGGSDPAKDGQADSMLAQAKGLVTRNPTQARKLCQKVMLLYNNNPKNPKVSEAYKLMGTIKGGKDDDDDF